MRTANVERKTFETEIKLSSGKAAVKLRIIVPLPTPEGPEKTNNRPLLLILLPPRQQHHRVHY